MESIKLEECQWLKGVRTVNAMFQIMNIYLALLIAYFYTLVGLIMPGLVLV